MNGQKSPFQEPNHDTQDLALRAAFGELDEAEQREFESLVQQDKAANALFTEYQALRALSGAGTAAKSGARIVEPRPETVSAILAAAQSAAESRLQTAPQSSAGFAETIRRWFESWGNWDIWHRLATAGACAAVLFFVYQVGVTPVDLSEPETSYDTPAMELVDYEIAATLEELDLLEAETTLLQEGFGLS